LIQKKRKNSATERKTSPFPQEGVKKKKATADRYPSALCIRPVDRGGLPKKKKNFKRGGEYWKLAIPERKRLKGKRELLSFVQEKKDTKRRKKGNQKRTATSGDGEGREAFVREKGRPFDLIGRGKRIIDAPKGDEGLLRYSLESSSQKKEEGVQPERKREHSKREGENKRITSAEIKFIALTWAEKKGSPREG